MTLRTQALLAAPVLRVMRLPLLFAELLRTTDAAHPEHAARAASLKRLEAVAMSVNNASRIAEQVRRVAGSGPDARSVCAERQTETGTRGARRARLARVARRSQLSAGRCVRSNRAPSVADSICAAYWKAHEKEARFQHDRLLRGEVAISEQARRRRSLTIARLIVVFIALAQRDPRLLAQFDATLLELVVGARSKPVREQTSAQIFLFRDRVVVATPIAVDGDNGDGSGGVAWQAQFTAEINVLFLELGECVNDAVAHWTADEVRASGNAAQYLRCTAADAARGRQGGGRRARQRLSTLARARRRLEQPRALADDAEQRRTRHRPADADDDERAGACGRARDTAKSDRTWGRRRAPRCSAVACASRAPNKPASSPPSCARSNVVSALPGADRRRAHRPRSRW